MLLANWSPAHWATATRAWWRTPSLPAELQTQCTAAQLALTDTSLSRLHNFICNICKRNLTFRARLPWDPLIPSLGLMFVPHLPECRNRPQLFLTRHWRKYQATQFFRPISVNTHPWQTQTLWPCHILTLSTFSHPPFWSKYRKWSFTSLLSLIPGKDIWGKCSVDKWVITDMWLGQQNVSALPVRQRTYSRGITSYSCTSVLHIPYCLSAYYKRQVILAKKSPYHSLANETGNK